MVTIKTMAFYHDDCLDFPIRNGFFVQYIYFSEKSAQINVFFVVFKIKQTILFLSQKYSLSA